MSNLDNAENDGVPPRGGHVDRTLCEEFGLDIGLEACGLRWTAVPCDACLEGRADGEHRRVGAEATASGVNGRR